MKIIFNISDFLNTYLTEKLHVEAIFNRTSVEIKNNKITVEIINKHDSIFGILKIIFYKKYFFHKTILYFSHIHINQVLRTEGNIFNLNLYSYEKYRNIFNYTILNNSIAQVDVPFTLEYSNKVKREQEVFLNVNFSFVEKEHFNRLKFFTYIFFTLLEGSNMCKVNFFKGLYLMEQIHNDMKEPVGYIDMDLTFSRKFNLLFFYALASYRTLTIFFNKRLRKLAGRDLRSKILEFLDVNDEDLLKINYKTENNIPHIIFKKKNRLYISIRGTESVKELYYGVDVSYRKFDTNYLEPEQVEKINIFDSYIHGGYQSLAKTFIENNKEDMLYFCEKYSCNEIIFVGHSLGGAIGGIITIILQKEMKERNIKMRTYGFGSPPFLSKELASIIPKELITTVINNNDLVSRLSFGHILDLRYKAISLAENKALINFNNMDLLIEYKRNIDKSLKLNGDIYPKLYLPGRLYHLKKIPIDCSRSELSLFHKVGLRGYRSENKYREVNMEYFDEIVVDKGFYSDHLFTGFYEALQIKSNKFLN